MTVDARSPVTRGISNAPLESFLLGKSQWKIFSDGNLQNYNSHKSINPIFKSTEKCNRGQPYNTTFKISGCAENEFTCNDGQCIDISSRYMKIIPNNILNFCLYRCDQIVNCRDQSDENNCLLLLLNPGYSSEVPPFSTVSIYL